MFISKFFVCQPVDNELTGKFANEKLAEEVVDKKRLCFPPWCVVVLVLSRPVTSRK